MLYEKDIEFLYAMCDRAKTSAVYGNFKHGFVWNLIRIASYVGKNMPVDMIENEIKILQDKLKTKGFIDKLKEKGFERKVSEKEEKELDKCRGKIKKQLIKLEKMGDK